MPRLPRSIEEYILVSEVWDLTWGIMFTETGFFGVGKIPRSRLPETREKSITVSM